MSALGHKQTFAVQEAMSASPPKATLNATYGMPAFGPSTDIPPLSNKRGSARQSHPDFGELAGLCIDLD
jgi:hypothetical protein